MKINKIEDIYPLTIVNMKHGKFAVINAYATATCADELQDNEEWQYEPHLFMKKEWSFIKYGIGDTINEAFDDFKERII